MPSASQCWRVACSSEAASARSTPNLDASDSSEYSDDTRSRTSRFRSSRRVTGGLDDLGQFLKRIEAEGAHAMLHIGFANRRCGLDRMHEAQGCASAGPAEPAALRQSRRHRNASRPAVHRILQQIGRRIGLHRIHRRSRKLLDEEPGSARRRMRAGKDDGFVRAERADYSLGIRMMVQLKGPPIGLSAKFRQKLPCGLEVPMGQRKRAYMPLRLNIK